MTKVFGALAALALLTFPARAEKDGVHLLTVMVKGSDLTVRYSKNFDTCVHLQDKSHQLLHTNNFYCEKGQKISVTRPLSDFHDLTLGTEVMLCHGNDSNVCSKVMTVVSGDSPTLPDPSDHKGI